MREELNRVVERLHNLYYLTQNLRDEGRQFIDHLRKLAIAVPDSEVPAVLAEAQAQLSHYKRLVGCRLSDEEIDKAVKWLTSQGDGYVSLPKWHIEKGFDNFAFVFPRWPHIPLHAYVQFDSNVENESPSKIFVAEERLFRDVKLLWRQINQLVGDGQTFRTRDEANQQDLSSYLRIIVGVIYNFLEAYLNGMAFDCFREFHDKLALEDHGLVAEWDSANKRPRFVSFERKLKEYPKVCGKYRGKELAFDAAPDVQYLAEEGKRLRDSLIHPSPYINFESKKPPKIQMIAGVTYEQVKKLLSTSIEYVHKVEVALGHDIAKTVPWLKL